MSLLWVLQLTCIKSTMNTFIKRAARQLSPFLSLKNHVPDPTALYDTLVNVVLLLRNGVLGSTGPVHKPIYLCFMMVCRPALCPPCSLQRLPLSPTKGSERLLTVPYRALYRAQRGELIDPLPCNLAAMFLYRNPGHCFSRSAVKIAAD